MPRYHQPERPFLTKKSKNFPPKSRLDEFLQHQVYVIEAIFCHFIALRNQLNFLNQLKHRTDGVNHWEEKSTATLDASLWTVRNNSKLFFSPVWTELWFARLCGRGGWHIFPILWCLLWPGWSWRRLTGPSRGLPPFAETPLSKSGCVWCLENKHNKISTAGIKWMQ